MPTDLMVTTNPGLEDVAAAELAEAAEAAGIDRGAIEWPEGMPAGRVRALIPADEPATRRLALGLRSIHHALRHVATFALPATGGLAEVDRRLRELPWPELDTSTPFRATSDRHGDHDFSSPELQGRAGATLQALTGAPVDLEHYAVNVQVDAVRERCIVGVRWTDRPLGVRFERRFNRRVALKPPVAYALLRLGAHGRTPAHVLDPFCGTGTILREAADLFPSATLHGSDTSTACVEGARENLAAAGLAGRSRIVQADARALDEAHAPGFDLLATNPPYGRKLGRGVNFGRLYGDLLAGARRLMVPGGRLAILVGKRGAFNTALQRTGGWSVPHVRVIDMNHVRAGLFVLERQ